MSGWQMVKLTNGQLSDKFPADVYKLGRNLQQINIHISEN